MGERPGQVIIAIVLLFVGVTLIQAVFGMDLDPLRSDGIAAYYLDNAMSDTAAVNAVAAVLLDYRAFDTFGEATVIFGSVVVVSMLATGGTLRSSGYGMSILVGRSIGFLTPFFWLFPIYVILNGHLSPGGGFQGGVSISVLVIVLSVAFGSEYTANRLSLERLGFAESAAALGFILVGLVGVLQGATFLANAAAGVPVGHPGELISAGIVAVLNIVIGCKVAAGLASIFFYMSKEGGEVR